MGRKALFTRQVTRMNNFETLLIQLGILEGTLPYKEEAARVVYYNEHVQWFWEEYNRALDKGII